MFIVKRSRIQNIWILIFFINKFITIQPAIYYKMSTNDFGGGSTVGLKIGAGFYF